MNYRHSCSKRRMISKKKSQKKFLEEEIGLRRTPIMTTKCQKESGSKLLGPKKKAKIMMMTRKRHLPKRKEVEGKRERKILTVTMTMDLMGGRERKRFPLKN